MSANTWQILHADALDAMSGMPSRSVHAIVTDPPYGLSFMGREWDHGVPSPPVWIEALRVARPGAHLLAFGGTRTYHRVASAIEDAGWEIVDTIAWVYGHGKPAHPRTRLKPAWEPITVARRPLVGSIDQNVAANGCGDLNIDACRIDVEDVETYERNCAGDRGHDGTREARATSFKHGGGRAYRGHTKPGRWPANFAHDGSDEVLSLLPGDAGAQAPVTRRGSDKHRNTFGAFAGHIDEDGSTFHGDGLGSAARFFYCARASRSERGEFNGHPTVKPVALMRWLVRLVARPGCVVLDPFAGSGSTGIAATAEGCSFIGIEKAADYVEIARRRIEAAA